MVMINYVMVEQILSFSAALDLYALEGLNRKKTISSLASTSHIFLVVKKIYVYFSDSLSILVHLILLDSLRWFQGLKPSF